MCGHTAVAMCHRPLPCAIVLCAMPCLRLPAMCPLGMCPLGMCPLAMCPLGMCPLGMCPLGMCPLGSVSLLTALHRADLSVCPRPPHCPVYSTPQSAAASSSARFLSS